MDAGLRHPFPGHVEAIHPGREARDPDAGLVPGQYAAGLADEWLANYRMAQEVIEQHQAIEDRRWTGAASGAARSPTARSYRMRTCTRIANPAVARCVLLAGRPARPRRFEGVVA